MEEICISGAKKGLESFEVNLSRSVILVGSHSVVTEWERTYTTQPSIECRSSPCRAIWLSRRVRVLA